MSAQNKILIGLVALIAFAVGISINMARVSEQIDTKVLLNAQLLVNDPAIEAAQTETLELTSIKESLGELTLVNFWASWCTPCREEMPIFETMYRQSMAVGFVVIGVAIDTPEKAQPMLDSMDITYPILYAQETGITIMESAGNPQALLPYSLLLDKNGKVLEQVLGKINEQQIAGWLADNL